MEGAGLSRPNRTMWALADHVATLFTCAATTARARMLAHASPLVRVMGERDALHKEGCLLERELAIFRSQRFRKPAKQRLFYAPEERAEILQVMRLRGWSAAEGDPGYVEQSLRLAFPRRFQIARIVDPSADQRR